RPLPDVGRRLPPSRGHLARLEGLPDAPAGRGAGRHGPPSRVGQRGRAVQLADARRRTTGAESATPRTKARARRRHMSAEAEHASTNAVRAEVRAWRAEAWDPDLTV